MKSFETEITFVAAVLAMALPFVAPPAMAVDLIFQARQLAAPARSYPELTYINDQIAVLIARLEANTIQLKAYRKAHIRATDRRYASLTREFNQSRSRMSELEHRLERARSLPAPAGSDRGSSSSDVRERAIAGEEKKYQQAKASLRQSLKALSDHYDQQLREIAKLR